MYHGTKIKTYYIWLIAVLIAPKKIGFLPQDGDSQASETSQKKIRVVNNIQKVADYIP
jgi:hypothetical protein